MIRLATYSVPFSTPTASPPSWPRTTSTVTCPSSCRAAQSKDRASSPTVSVTVTPSTSTPGHGPEPFFSICIPFSLHGRMLHQKPHVHVVRRAAGGQLEAVFQLVFRVHFAVLQPSAGASHHFNADKVFRIRERAVQRHGYRGGRFLDLRPARFSPRAVRDGHFRQIRVVFFRVPRRNRGTGKLNGPVRHGAVQRRGRHVDDPRLGLEHIDDDHARLLRGIAGHAGRVRLVCHRVFPSVHEHHAVRTGNIARGRAAFGKCHTGFDATVFDGRSDFLKARESRLLVLLHGKPGKVKPQFQPGKKRLLHVRGIVVHRVFHGIHFLFQIQGTVAELFCLNVVYAVFPAHHGVGQLNAVNPVFPLRCFFQIRHVSPALEFDGPGSRDFYVVRLFDDAARLAGKQRPVAAQKPELPDALAVGFARTDGKGKAGFSRGRVGAAHHRFGVGPGQPLVIRRRTVAARAHADFRYCLARTGTADKPGQRVPRAAHNHVLVPVVFDFMPRLDDADVENAVQPGFIPEFHTSSLPPYCGPLLWAAAPLCSV
nr:MAG TPA: hypothetical protein [Caudoviricetes sp.]